MSWFEILREIEPFDELPFDQTLVEALEISAREQPLGVLRFFTPTFRSYASEELKGCGKASFPGLLDHRRRLCAQLRPLPSENSRTDDRGDKPSELERKVGI